MTFDTFYSDDRKTKFKIKDIGVNSLSKNDFGIYDKKEFFDIRYTINNNIESVLIYHSENFGIWDIEKIKHEIMQMKNEKLVKFKVLPLTLQYLTKKILESDSGMYFMETPEKDFVELPDYHSFSDDCIRLEYLCEISPDNETPYLTVYAGALEKINFIDCPELLDQYMQQYEEEAELN